jgi:hypothetical protein
MKKLFILVFELMLFTALECRFVQASTEDPSACLGEIERVCVNLEDKLETCLSNRGDQLTPGCRDQLKKAMALMDDPTGPAACVPDVQRLCPDLKSQALISCIASQKANFSDACKRYLQSARQGATTE